MSKAILDEVVSLKAMAAHLNHLWQKEHQESIRPIRLHKTLYFIFGCYIAEREGQKELLPPLPFENEFVCGIWGPIVPSLRTQDDIDDLPSREWVPSTKKEIFLHELTNEVLRILADRGDFSLVEMTHAGYAYRYYGATSPKMKNVPIETSIILEEFKQRSNGM